MEEKDYIRISEYARRMDMALRTAYREYHRGKLIGVKDPDTGMIRIKNPFKAENKFSNRVVLYARVSSSQNKSNLDSQMDRLRLYAVAKGYNIVSEVKEVGSGMNEDRPKLNKLLSKPEEFDVLLVEHKDRLTRFGFRFIELMLINLNKRVEVINLVSDDKEDLMEDFVSVITSFCARIYGKRRSKRNTERIIKELNDES